MKIKEFKNLKKDFIEQIEINYDSDGYTIWIHYKKNIQNIEHVVYNWIIPTFIDFIYLRFFMNARKNK